MDLKKEANIFLSGEQQSLTRDDRTDLFNFPTLSVLLPSTTNPTSTSVSVAGQ
ncbi:hypothetical protein [Carboxylicivirga taeanensis]|uniref:hypothetical protein n=1 Tax=Carboxylicivirga taeanensis TaxID=1416875 RepID=UPI003F6E3CD7